MNDLRRVRVWGLDEKGKRVTSITVDAVLDPHQLGTVIDTTTAQAIGGFTIKAGVRIDRQHFDIMTTEIDVPGCAPIRTPVVVSDSLAKRAGGAGMVVGRDTLPDDRTARRERRPPRAPRKRRG